MKKIISVILAAVLAVSVLCIGAGAVYGDTVIPTKTLNKVLDAYRKVIKNGETYMPLSEYGIYNGSDGAAYSELFTAFIINNGDYASFMFGKYSETYATIEIQGEVGENFTGVKIEYPEQYMGEDGKCDMERINKDKELISARYRTALSLVSRKMTDIEKALILYDFVILCADYPDPVGTDINGGDLYHDDAHVVTGLLRDGYGVCSGYAKLYALLLNDSGVPAITVESIPMNHEWVMVKIGDEWYHADPTWDDPRYESGYTEFLDPTEDPWDIGAVTHYYFLKSDEEIKELGHYDWDVSYSVNPDYLFEAPESGSSGAFDDMFFSDMNDEYLCISAMNYINGNWYFTDLLQHAVIRITPDGGAEKVPFPDEEYPKYSFGYESDLYISTNHSIYRYDTISDKFDKILEIADEDAEISQFSEMRVIFDEMTLITIIDNSGDGTFSSFDTNSDTFSMEEMRYTDALTTIKNESDDDEGKVERRDPVQYDGPGKRPVVTTGGKTPASTEATVKDIAPFASQSGSPVILYVIIGAAAAVVLAVVITIIKKRGR